MNVLETTEPCTRTDAVLAFLQRLLEGAGPGSLSDILESLAEAFAVDGAGLFYPVSGPVVLTHTAWLGKPVQTFPWDGNQELLARIADSTAALTHHGPGSTSWLLGTIGQPSGPRWVLWLFAHGARTWTPAECASLTIAGECLAKHLAADPDAESWRNITERAQTQDRIERTAGVTTRLAHDFGNVLTGILGFAELALPHAKADSLPHRYLSEVVDSARQGARWVQKLQTFSRRYQPKFVPTSLYPVLGEEENRPDWRSGVHLKVDLPADLPQVAMDLESLRQVLSAFLDNAREAKASLVRVSAQVVDLTAPRCLEVLGNNRPGAHVEVTIRDDGAGITGQVRERLFRDFLTSTKGRRRGLGLAVAYGILHSFHAGFRVEPATEAGTTDQGTEIRVYLPVSTVRANPPATTTGNAAGDGPRILVVDDDPMVLGSLCRSLEGAGYRVNAAPGPLEAITQFSQAAEPFHLVLTDVIMHDLNGLDMARRIQYRDPRANFLFISSQAHQDPLLVRFPLLSKPFEGPTLLRAVGDALGNPKR